METGKRKMVLDWMRKIHTLEHAHRLDSIRWMSYNNWFGIPSLIIGALIGALGSVCDIRYTLLSQILSSAGGVIVAILAGIQTFLKPTEFAEKHRAASITYEKLRHKIEYLLLFKSASTPMDTEIEKINHEWQAIDAMNVSTRNFRRAKEIIKKMDKYPEELGFLDEKA